MKMAVIFIGLLFSIAAQATPVGCEDAPEKAKTELPSPIDEWAVIFCSPKGHVMGAIDGTLWMTDQNTPFMFLSNPKPSPYASQHSSYFETIIRQKVVGDLKTKMNKILSLSTYYEDQTLQPWQVDLKSTKGISYNVFFYLKEDKVKYVLGCTNRCLKSVLLTAKSLSQLNEELKSAPKK